MWRSEVAAAYLFWEGGRVVVEGCKLMRSKGPPPDYFGISMQYP